MTFSVCDVDTSVKSRERVAMWQNYVFTSACPRVTSSVKLSFQRWTARAGLFILSDTALPTVRPLGLKLLGSASRHAYFGSLENR